MPRKDSVFVPEKQTVCIHYRTGLPNIASDLLSLDKARGIFNQSTSITPTSALYIERYTYDFILSKFSHIK